MSSKSRFSTGGFEPRFVVKRTDGKPCRETARYIVMDGSGADPHAIKAIRAYAKSVKSENEQLSKDLLSMIDDVWPVDLAQHENAK